MELNKVKLLLCDDKKVNTYTLTNSGEDSLVIDYYYDNSDVFETITLKRLENSWSIENTINIEIIGNKKDSYVEYDRVSIRFLSTNKVIMLHFLPFLEDYIDISIGNLETINIGSSPECHLEVKGFNESAVFAQIIKRENDYIIKTVNERDIIYVNGFAVKEQVLSIGDYIFVYGLRIIWMRGFIKVSRFNDKVSFRGVTSYTPRMVNEQFSLPSEFERNVKLFSDNQVFFHTPRMQTSIHEESIKLDPPPEADKEEHMPMFLTIGTSSILCLTSFSTGLNALRNFGVTDDKLGVTIELITSVAMLLVSLLVPILTVRWQKKKEKNKTELRKNKYSAYLENKRNIINKIIKDQEEILLDNNLSLEEIQKRILNGGNNIWIREIPDDDFLNVRLGIGELNAAIDVEAPPEQFFLYDDDLRDKAFELANSKKLLTNVPITISMAQNKIVSFIFNASYKQDYINSIMLQIMYYYSPMDLKIALFTTEENSNKWDYIKYLPHVWSAKRDKRLYAENDNESLLLSSYLDQIFDKRVKITEENQEKEKVVTAEKKDLYKNYTEYYLIITDNFKEVKNVPIVDRLLNSNVNVGFSLVVFGDDIKTLPSKLDKFVDVQTNISGVYSKDLKNNDKCQFKSEYVPNIRLEKFAKCIANIPIDNKVAGYNLPTSLNFMELYHAGKISHLNITKKWVENDPTVSLFAPIGVKDNGKVIGLDLHEKVHGPHGLIAGSTGSGKSEFIITYILSMAINYSPKEVQFILIDYKGGGLAGAFENRSKGIKIPHLVGTITNLDTSEMNRTLVSIQSELKRRQAKFNEAREILGEGTIDIYKYQKMYREGKILEPMSHLFVICDEFAELKQQQPDFMAELISTSRIGRSLGVHLILATQKPSGVVDDQIWSNARFKVCLKVQTEGDSNEMIKRPDAAMIKETGRFYLQIGNNESFEFGQSAWTGAKYTPVEHLRNKIDDSLDFLSNDGTIIKKINEPEKNDGVEAATGEQLVNIVKYLYDLAIKDNIEFSSLWLPSLPKTLLLSDIIRKYAYKANSSEYKAVIGEYDKPSKQKQGIYELDLNSKNTIVFGLPNSGKENFVSNVIYSLSISHSPNDVNFYILDFGSESLSPFIRFPHVGDYITVTSKDKINAYLKFLENEIRKRKEMFVEYGGSFESYCKNSGSKAPLIVTILNSYESFMENCFDSDEWLTSLLREGNKYGIVFITTAVSTNSVRSSVVEYYVNKVLLQCNDSFDYQYLLGAPSGMMPSKNFGRGMTVVDDEACEFQSAIIADDAKYNETIKSIGKTLTDAYDYEVEPIKLMPEKITLNSMFKYAKQINKIPLGYTRDSVELYYEDFVNNKVTNIIGNNVTNDIGFMCSIIDLIDSIKDVKMNIFDFITCIDTDGNASYYSISFDEPFNALLENNEDELTINIIIGIGNMYEVFNDEEREAFDNLMNNMYSLNNQVFIIFDNNDRFSKVTKEAWYQNINKNYIWCGKYIDSQNIFDISNVTNFDLEENIENLVYIMKENGYVVIKGVGGSDEEV